jgi:NAD(P)-dependent dehydrogenase (short-subunit alcohol dehydrogenase family)
MTSIFADDLLKDQTAVITGGGSGINLRIAERYAFHGAHVVVVGRTQETLDHAVELIKSQGGSALGLSADVREYDALARVMDKSQEEFGTIDHVVCGAAGNFPAPAVALSANGFRTVVDIDLNGTFNTCRSAFEHLTKPGASILCISATLAWLPTPFQSHVCAAKAGVDAFARTLALEWGGMGIRVNIIAPGPVDDTEGMKRLTPTKEAREKLTQGIPLKRYVTKDEIADLALFLSSSAASAITGGTFICDGGQQLGGSSAFTAALGM